MTKRYSFPTMPLLFGHRGYSSLAPENTLAAFSLCVEKGIPAVELDVQLCKTGELVIVHDDNMKRVSGLDALVRDLTFDELRELDVGDGQRVPLLSELFEECSRALYYDIELKVPSLSDEGLGEKLWHTLTSYGLQDRCMISSFNPFALRAFRSVSKGSLPTAVIFSESPSVPAIFRHGWGRHIAQCSYLKPESVQINAHFIKKFKDKKGYPIAAWTINSLEEAERVLRLGSDALISDDPGALLDLVLEKQTQQKS